VAALQDQYLANATLGGQYYRYLTNLSESNVLSAISEAVPSSYSWMSCKVMIEMFTDVCQVERLPLRTGKHE
jgi:hypothetical protein